MIVKSFVAPAAAETLPPATLTAELDGDLGGAEGAETGESHSRLALENQLLKAKVAHLEAVIDTARALLSTNQEKLLRQLHEAPRDLVDLTLRLRSLQGA